MVTILQQLLFIPATVPTVRNSSHVHKCEAKRETEGERWGGGEREGGRGGETEREREGLMDSHRF